MTATLITPPLVEPVSLTDMKAFLKLDHDAEDDLLRAFISTARVHLEHMTSRHFISQTWRVTLDRPLGPIFSLSMQPVAQIISASILSAKGELQLLSADCFSIYQKSDPATIVNLAGVLLAESQRLQLELETGFGPAAEDVPDPLTQAIRLVAAAWYERRVIADPSQLPDLFSEIRPLVSPYRAVHL